MSKSPAVRVQLSKDQLSEDQLSFCRSLFSKSYFTKYKVHAIGLEPELNFMVRFHWSLNLESSCGFERGVYIEIGTVVFVFLQRKQGLKCSMHIAPAHHHHHQYCRESPSHPARRAREAETLMQ